MLAATLRVAGMTLLEYQVRQAHAAGAAHIVVLANRLPQSLITAFNRLERDKIKPELARSARDAADRIHPDETLLVISGGIFATPDVIARVAGSASPVLLTRDPAGGDAFERIDATAHWSGIALLDGGMLRETASVLGDWTLGPTLLRIAVQRDVARDHVGAGQADTVLHLANDADAEAANRLLATGDFLADRLIDRLYTPVGSLALPRLMGSPSLIGLAPFVPLVLLAAAIGAAVAGYGRVGIVLLLIAHFPAWLAVRLARATGDSSRLVRLIGPAMAGTASALCLALGWWQYDQSGDQSVVALALFAAAQFHPKLSWRQTVDPLPAMLILLVAISFGMLGLGFTLVIMASLFSGLWRSFRVGNAALS